MGPRCTAVQQVRTKPDRMICDDGRQMIEQQRERNDTLGEEERLKTLMVPLP